MNVPFGVPFTLDQAYPFVRGAIVAFGFPDILFEPDQAFVQLLSYVKSGSAAAALGLFPADQPDKVDMVELDNETQVRRIVVKPRQTQLRYSWGIAVWTPVFTEFLHQYVSSRTASVSIEPELSVGEVFQAAIEKKLRVDGVQVSDKPYLDIGTSEGLVRAIKHFGGQQP
jgi:glucose-1-phosphate thymidylyltransferase